MWCGCCYELQVSYVAAHWKKIVSEAYFDFLTRKTFFGKLKRHIRGASNLTMLCIQSSQRTYEKIKRTWYVLHTWKKRLPARWTKTQNILKYCSRTFQEFWSTLTRVNILFQLCNCFTLKVFNFRSSHWSN